MQYRGFDDGNEYPGPPHPERNAAAESIPVKTGRTTSPRTGGERKRRRSATDRVQAGDGGSDSIACTAGVLTADDPRARIPVAVRRHADVTPQQVRIFSCRFQAKTPWRFGLEARPNQAVRTEAVWAEN